MTRYVTIINDQQFEIEITRDGTLLVNGEPRHVDFLELGQSLYSLITESRSIEAVIEENKHKVDVLLGGRLYEGMVLDERALMMAQRRGGLGGGSGEVRSPMPGLIVSVAVQPGEQITPGQTVVILESMKMQNELKATIAGVVASVHISAGQTVDKDALLVTVTPGD